MMLKGPHAQAKRFRREGDMPELSRLVTFAIATLILNLTPGPDMMYVVARSVGQGSSGAVYIALGLRVGLTRST